MFLSKISIHLCIDIHYIKEGNIFVDIISKLLEQQKNCNVVIKNCFKINGKQNYLRRLRRVNILNSKSITAWKVPKYRVISGPYFPVFSLNTEKYGPEITPYPGTFHAVYERKVKSTFMIYADFECILVPEDNGKQKNPNEFYTNNYQKHVACSDGNKLVCFDDKFSKPF